MTLKRELSDVDWPEGVMVILALTDYEELRKELLEPEGLAWITIRAANGSMVEVCETEVYDRAAYKRANEVMNERIRPRGTQMHPYVCESCEHQILLVTKAPKAQTNCEVCQGRMVRTTT